MDELTEEVIGSFFADKINYQEFPAPPTKPEPVRKPYIETLKDRLQATVYRALVKTIIFNDELHSGQTVGAQLSKLDLDELVKEIVDLQGRILSLKKQPDDSFERAIQRAREYPIKDLVEFNRAGFALCLWHTEKQPSMHLKDNRVYCFSCGAPWKDSIDVYMQIYGVDFRTAVKALGGDA
jgi:hypothetical protein